MGVIMKNKVNYTGGGSGGGNANEMTLTMAEYLALTEEQRMDGTTYYITDGVSTKEIQPVIYSEEEREIGVWTDGKPLYQKSFQIDNVNCPVSGNSRQAEWNISSYVDDVEVPIRIEGVIIDTGSQRPLDRNLPANNGYSYATYVEHAMFGIAVGGSVSLSNVSIMFTLFYTKTTDTAGSGTWTTDGAPTVHYDGNEKVIGTWFGETLYEKTIDCGALPNNTSKSVAHGISNIDYVSYIGGVAKSSNGGIPIPFAHRSNISNQIQIGYDATNINIFTATDQTNYTKCFITLRYTKSS